MRARHLGLCLLAVCMCAGCDDDEEPTAHEEPATETSGSLHLEQLCLGAHHRCGRTQDHRAVCWGGNEGGQLGDGTVVSREEPRDVGLADVEDVVCGVHSSCARTADGDVFCWGLRMAGALGDGQTGFDSRQPRPTPVGLSPATHLFASDFTTCARTEDDALWCWGRMPGRGGTRDVTTPERMAPELSRTTAVVSAGDGGRCVAREDGAVLCWGDDLLLGDRLSLTRPTEIELPGRARALLGDIGMACAALENEDVYCWGHGSRSLFGAPDKRPFRTPLRGTSLAGEERALCAASVGGPITCVGVGGIETASGRTRLSRSVSTLPRPSAVRSVVGDRSRICALLPDGAPLCLSTFRPNG